MAVRLGAVFDVVDGFVVGNEQAVHHFRHSAADQPAAAGAEAAPASSFPPGPAAHGQGQGGAGRGRANKRGSMVSMTAEGQAREVVRSVGLVHSRHTPALHARVSMRASGPPRVFVLAVFPSPLARSLAVFSRGT